ncbi:hypothetical protein AB0H57_24590 [Micromonospora sp. NPDC050686]|uniref:hypothetical protein n=1 Tax=Micromonospora sp. NPDC050686 TaxID=3154631 RepID=UPI003406EB08
MTGPGLTDWERGIVDSAVVSRSNTLQGMVWTFSEQLRALDVLDAHPKQIEAALDRLHADIVKAADQARDQTRALMRQIYHPERAA